MFRMRCFIGAAVAFLLIGLYCAPAQAVILYRNGRNIYTPGGTLYNSGWQYEGNFGSFLGTPIAPNYFITAGHIGGNVGQAFSWGGKNWTTTAMFDDPSSDLRIWKVNGSFWNYAPIYTGSAETGKTAITIGRGTQKGAAVTKGTTIKGWKWGTADAVRTWGTNVSNGAIYGGTDKGYLLRFPFNASGGTADEGTLSTGDSGGGVFINDNGTWRLAGINFLVDGPFSLTGGSDPGFMASVFDKGGLYSKNGTTWQMNFDLPNDLPGNWYATRISARAGWIQSIIGTGAARSASAMSVTGAVPEPGGLMVAGALAILMGRRRRGA